jgi:hypothetical protein
LFYRKKYRFIVVNRGILSFVYSTVAFQNRVFLEREKVSLRRFKIKGLKRFNRFKDSKFVHKSNCIASSQKTVWVRSDTVASPIKNYLQKKMYRFIGHFFRV